MKRSSICALVSGGLDSDVLAAELSRRYRRVYPVYIRQGLRWEAVELYWLKRFLNRLSFRRKPESRATSLDPGFRRGDGVIQPLTILELPMSDVYGAHWSVGEKPAPGYRSPDRAVYLPGRNLVLLAKTAVFCALHKVRRVALGSLNHNPFPDAAPPFFRSWSRALRLGLGAELSLQAPFRRLSKAAVIQRGKGLPLELSFSCLAPKGRRHCGRCNKCAERQRAFRKAGVQDLTLYAGLTPLARASRGRGLG